VTEDSVSAINQCEATVDVRLYEWLSRMQVPLPDVVFEGVCGKINKQFVSYMRRGAHKLFLAATSLQQRYIVSPC